MPPYIWMLPYVWMPPVCLMPLMFGWLPVSLDVPICLPVCLDTPIHLGAPLFGCCLYAWTPHMFGCPPYVWMMSDAPCTYTTQRKHAL